jgi:uncharacterized repeat protein (TIGR03803 family)
MRLLRSGFCAFFSAGLLSACAGNSAVSPSNSAAAPIAPPLSRSLSSTENVVYRFGGGTDGYYPSALVDVNGTLYGTTQYGGNTLCSGSVGCGTLFEIGPSGSGYRVIHRFASARDGLIPVAALTDDGGTLYGTTRWGGEHRTCSSEESGCGTIFQIDPLGKRFFTIYRFDRKDGSDAFPGLVNVGSALYGATLTGGQYCHQSGCGTIYSLSAAGTETVLHSFAGSPDGGGPAFPPIAVDGRLYGVTNYGGDPQCHERKATVSGCGVLYSMRASGAGYRVLHRFEGGDDGSAPASIIAVNGMLYGNTFGGGKIPCRDPAHRGCGTIYEITTSGTGYTVLHEFMTRDDGATPDTLAYVNGTLYGTTTYGGGTSCQNGIGCGTVFEIDPSGSNYGVIYRFQGGKDGANPGGKNQLIEIGGLLYGVTTLGGGSGCQYGTGCGAVFSVTP